MATSFPGFMFLPGISIHEFVCLSDWSEDLSGSCICVALWGLASMVDENLLLALINATNFILAGSTLCCRTKEVLFQACRGLLFRLRIDQLTSKPQKGRPWGDHFASRRKATVPPPSVREAVGGSATWTQNCAPMFRSFRGHHQQNQRQWCPRPSCTLDR